jgi:outer membrane protein OmpA-like peptidoglycan-associated protein
MTHRIALGAAAVAALSVAGCESVHKVQSAVYSPCHPTGLTLYFEPSSDQLTSDGLQIVKVTARRMRGCKVSELRLVGLADPAGTPQDNIELSRRRADHVLDAFVREGVPAPKYTLIARGDAGALGPGGVVQPVRRRVDVTVVAGK